MDLNPLTRPRRILIAVALLALLGGGGIGVGGLASAAAEDGAPVYGFSVPAPRVGDHGAYSVVDTRGVFPLEHLAFAWEDDRRIVVPEGHAVRANVLRLEEIRDLRTLGTSVETSTQRHSLLLRAGTSEVLAEGRYDESASMRAGAGLSPGASSRAYEEDEYTFFEFVRNAPCGLRNPLQGAPWDLGSQAIPNTMVCETSPWGDDPVGAWTPVSVLDASPRVVIFEETINRDEGGTTWQQQNRYWMQEGLPYPIRIESETSGHDAGTVTYVLDRFNAGTVAISTESQVAAAPMPRLRWVDTTSTGPSEQGIEHAFPLSQAYAWALNDPENQTLAAFMEEHPDAYMAWARHASYTAHEDRVWQWSFALTDGHSVLAVGVERRTGPLVVEGVGVGGLPPPAIAVPGSDQTTISRTQPARPWHFGDATLPRPEDAPATMPTVASMWDQWRHLADLQGHDGTPNHWGFSIGCDEALADLGRPCAYGRFQAWAGFGDMVWERETVLEPEPEQRIEGSYLYWIEGDLFRHATFVSETTWIAAGAPAPQPASADAEPIASLHGAWRAPGAAVVAGFTLTGLLAALTYWFWPVLKGGPLALFSRVRTEALLENPTRAAIMQAIAAQPGIHQRELARVTGAGKGALDHHLQKLEAGRLLSRHAGTGYTCYFPYGQVDRRLVSAAVVLRAPAAQNILHAIRERPGLSSSDVAARTGLSNSTVHHHLSRLRQEGLVEASRVAGKHALRLTEAGETARGAFAS